VFETPKLVETAGNDARYPSISRTSRLAYQQYTRNWDIRRAEIVGPEGTSAHRLKQSTPLIASTRLDGAPAWSPDGAKIAFLSDRSGDFELWICDADGSNTVRLTTFSGPGVINPRWSPDGKRLIFSALTGPNSSFEGYFINAKGGAPERISAPAQRSMAYPILSRDGRWIYFIPGPEERAVEAWRIPSTGGEAVQITRHGAFQPEESPDGKSLYYGKYRTHGLWRIPIAGGEEQQILNSISGGNWAVGTGGIYYFDFPEDPDAPKLAEFYSFKSGRSSQIGTVEPTVLDGYEGLSLSPDGRWLLYTVVTKNSDLMLVDHFR
jgi:Tol biopolymer transport system component